MSEYENVIEPIKELESILQENPLSIQENDSGLEIVKEIVPEPECVDTVPECVVPEPECVEPVPECVVPEPECVVPEPECVVPEPECVEPVPECVVPEPECVVPEPEFLEPVLQPVSMPVRRFRRPKMTFF
jgi:hypothetical protein